MTVFGADTATRIKAGFDANTETDNPPKHSYHVTPSQLDDECVARQWYKFRWVLLPRIPVRILRLFEKGHATESMFEKTLKRDGWTVESVDPARVNEFNPQYRVKALGGHMSGYLDGIGSHPIFTNNIKVLLEYKTYNTKRFVELVRNGVRKNDYKYYMQVCIYMLLLDLPGCVFIATNKNDSDLYIETIDRDDVTATQGMNTASDIVGSRVRPARFSESPVHHVCKYCDYINICHYGEKPDINCRSCVNAQPVDGGVFLCHLYNSIIPDNVLVKGCPNHSPVS